MSVGRIIAGPEDLRAGAMWLSDHCPRMRHAIGAVGPLPLRRQPEGFAQLLSAIVSQQVSVASADAIWSRVQDAGLTTPAAIRAASDEDLRACGLSRPKMRYARALADADLPFDQFAHWPDEEVIACLTKVTGIGAWTAEIYAMFSLGRADVFASADLALQESARVLYDLAQRPTARQMQEMAQDWSPWRAVAARVLWAYYRVEKQREGIR